MTKSSIIFYWLLIKRLRTITVIKPTITKLQHKTDITIIWLIINLVTSITMQQANQSKKKITNLIIQCNTEPTSPNKPISPTILKATLNAIIPINPIIIEFTK